MNSVKQSFDLLGKIAVITGGAGLLGVKHAEAIAEFGGIPVLLDIDKKIGVAKSKRICEKYQVDCEFFYCDITDESQITGVRDSLIKKYSRIDILINNATIDPKVNNEKSGKSFSRLEFFNLDQWNLELKVGLTGAFLCTKTFGYFMAQNGGGKIINISSDLGVIAPDQRLYRLEGVDEEN